MNKSELVETVVDSAEISKADGTKLIEGVFAAITNALKSGEQVVLPGFGTFSVGNRAARMGRNPKTGEEIQIKASRVAKFKAGKALKEAVQDE